MNCCNIVYKDENRKVITTKDIQKYCTVKAWSYTKVFKENDTSLRDYIFSLGFQYQSSGNGLNYYFDDGERVRSQHELDFTKFLRERLNLVYGSNYFRDIKYKTFIDNYKETMDCDYIIKLENRTIYVEIIGMLKGYEKKWRNIILKSKSKTKYIKHLKLKEQMLIENNLEYYFLFPSDLQEDFLMSIFKKEAE
jgi:hypothetical protein